MNKTRPDLVWRRLTPHAFGNDEFRWHTRAFCHTDRELKDFLLPRILEARAFGEPGATGDQDWLWHRLV
jgi:predicted DNA-binding transcriptional regulator YafY